MLFDPRAHEPLCDAEWHPAQIEAEIRAIGRDADDAMRDRDWWPLHPLDDDGKTPDAVHGVYLGAAGVMWAIDHLAQAGLHEPRHDYARLAGDVLESYLRRPEFDGPMPSLFLGESGIALVAWLLSPTGALADRLHEIVVTTRGEDTLELFWGSPGLLPVAGTMLERTGEPRWAAAWSAIADPLLLRWGERVPDFWTQRISESAEEGLGPAHGLTGVVAALARRPDLLPHDRLAPATIAALEGTAICEGGRANWPPSRREGLAEPDGFIRTQWCHGAPGIVASTAALPREDRLDALLLAGGELTWTAGPVAKGPGLCHGTAGNGYALLKLFTRTGDELWLHRARRFAMHAAAQAAAAREENGRGRYSLWTGDPGVAVYLQRCIDGTSDMPTIDTW
jgi:hypothetical protein